jgi:DMSO/TMAO reductase YedYZ molybdopterin-dependent catalytic subunit
VSEAPAQPENRPAPLEALLEPVTPIEAHYRRNHFPYPVVDPESWTLTVDGAVERPATLDLAAVRAQPRRELTVLLECAGHRRTEYDPPITGVQWKTGALSQARWGGAPLSSVLSLAGVRPDAAEVVLYGADRGPFAAVPGVHPFARSLPLEKAMHPDTLLAWEMNGQPLPAEHGAPLRVVVPGWYAMDSVKWLTRIEVVTEPFRGPFQELDYRFQPEGETGIGERLTQVPVHSLFVGLEDGSVLPHGSLTLRGIAWGGAGVERVEVQVEGGPWLEAAVQPAASPYERSTWSLPFDLPPGEHVLAVRASDRQGSTQPEKATWNRRGYANNGVQRITITVR